MSLEELRNVGVKAGIFTRQSNGVCRVSNDFNKFYESHRKPSRIVNQLLGDYMEKNPNAGMNEDGTKVNITRITFEFIIDRWIHEKNIVLTENEFKLATDALMKVLE